MNNWHRIKMWTEKKLLKPHKLFGVFRLYDTNGGGAYGKEENKLDKNMENRIKKFLTKYPHAENFTALDPTDPEHFYSTNRDPVSRFLLRQDKFIAEGFSEDKAFELAEKEMSEELQKEKYERSLFEGLATSNRSRSLMSIYEQKAEYESRQKVAQLTRDMGNFKRFQADLETRYDEILQEKGQHLDQSRNIEESTEKNEKYTKKYEPVTYRTPDMSNPEGENKKSIQNLFSARSEKLLDYFHSFAEIKDGISNLTDREIILKANETPSKLKDSFNILRKKLEKYEIELNSQGKIDYTKIKDQNSLSWIKTNEKLITVCLLCKDLNFEAPHIINRNEIKNRIMSEIEDEEQRLRNAADRQSQLESESEIERMRKKKTNYESYFGILPNYNADVLAKKSDRFSEGAGRNMKKFVKFEEFVKEFSNRYMFDNDLLYETYYYWEDLDEKEMRLRELWINSRKERLEKNINRPESLSRELQKLNDNISVLVRNLRRKIDQTLLKNRKHPIFGANYRYYKYDEFMLDSEIEFHKIKKFLETSPEKIKNDPEIGYKYKELINLLKRKKIGEATTAQFEDPIDEFVEEKVQEEQIDDDFTELIESNDKVKISGKSRSARKELEKALGGTGKVEKVDEELGKVKESIVSHFENIIKTQVAAGTASKKDKKLLDKTLNKNVKPTMKNTKKK
jgi:hypothetical protein